MGLSKIVLDRFPFGLVNEMIVQHDLHRGWPVDLTPLYKKLGIRIYRDIILPDEIKAYSAYHKTQGHGIAVFDAGLDGPDLAHAQGHEMGHLLSQQLGRLHGCVTSPGGMVRREEQEADLVASYLLIPGRPFYEMCRAECSLEEIAATFNVPVRLLQFRAELMVAHDEFGVVSNPFYRTDD